MPTYDYYCPANGLTVEVEHKLAETMSTWGELCERSGQPRGRTRANAAVERLITGGSVVRAAALGSRRERPCDSAPCAAPRCGGGGCGLN